MTKEIRELKSKLTREGWQVEHTRKGHLKWTSPSGATYISGTSLNGGKRGYHNFCSALRRMGAPV